MPELNADLVIFWDAFLSLSQARSYSLGFTAKGEQYIGPDALRVSEISAYAAAMEMKDVEQKMRMIRILQRMDSVYLNIGKVK